MSAIGKPGWTLLVRSLPRVSLLFFVLAVAAAADPDRTPGTASPAGPTTPPATSPSPASDEPKKPQSPLSAETKPKAEISPTEIRQLRDRYFKQCMQDWDAGTHMTKKDWERTCLRVVENRVKFLTEQKGK